MPTASHSDDKPRADGLAGPSPPWANSAAKMSTQRSSSLSLTRAQLVEDPRGGKTIGNPATSRLEIANCGAGFHPQLPVGLAHIVTMTHKQLLKFQPFSTRQHALVARPILRERRPATQPVR